MKTGHVDTMTILEGKEYWECRWLSKFLLIATYSCFTAGKVGSRVNKVDPWI